jgi:hypothetical protein
MNSTELICHSGKSSTMQAPPCQRHSPSHQAAPLPWGQSAQVAALCSPHETLAAEQTLAKSTIEYKTIACFVIVSMVLIVFDDAIWFFVREIHNRGNWKTTIRYKVPYHWWWSFKRKTSRWSQPNRCGQCQDQSWNGCSGGVLVWDTDSGTELYIVVKITQSSNIGIWTWPSK